MQSYCRGFFTKTSPDSGNPSDRVAETLIHDFIASCLDYCNRVRSGYPAKPWTCSSVCRTQQPGFLAIPWHHINPTLIHLHWLPVKSCIPGKILPLKNPCILLPPSRTSDTLSPYTVPGSGVLRHRPSHRPWQQPADFLGQSLQCGSPTPPGTHSRLRSPMLSLWKPF